MMMAFRLHVLAIIWSINLSYGQNLDSSLCRSDEVCVTVQRCNETDDSGRFKGIQPRIARFCGPNMNHICCEREQLENWDADAASRAGKPTSGIMTKSIVGQSIGDDEELKNESCGPNMECVPRRLCQDNIIIDDGRHIINPRIGTSGCSKSLHRCCRIDEKVNEDESPYIAKITNFKYRGCGWSNPMGLIPDKDTYEYESDVSLFGEFPWMMAIFTGRNEYLCGATLVHPQLVITSAHNIKNQTVDTMVARAGEWDLNSLDEPHKHVVARIRKIITHEEFDPDRYYNDIALLVLEEPMKLAPHIQPLCLPQQESPKVKAEFKTGVCYATGWGSKKPNSDKLERVLKRIDLPVVGKAECQGMLRITVLGLNFRLRPSFICAGGQRGKDTCKGDGGSPLFCSLPGHTDRFQLAGIVSWGVQCAEEDVPAVYVNVAYLRNWIDDNVKALNLTLEKP
ncbi:phenoloxidase-activating factor 2 [Drosophila tropicalis]|uniref:phenoloxidase-activating factor 2 n=1 Tax=Drosophila tropicalis TaxID=46794 RepID=UPI0035ABC319